MRKPNQIQMKSPRSCGARRPLRAGFTLVEIMVVIGIMVILIGISASVLSSRGAKALRTGGENLTASIEQARSLAITRRKEIALVILQPGQGGFDDGLFRLGLFEVEEAKSGNSLDGVLIQRWLKMPTGIVFFGGEVDALSNVVDESPVALSWRNGTRSAEVQSLVFSARGGLSQPQGSESMVVTIGRGVFRDGTVTPVEQGARRTLRVGRVVARPWLLDT